MTGERMRMAHLLSTSQRSLHFGGHRASLSILQSRYGLSILHWKRDLLRKWWYGQGLKARLSVILEVPSTRFSRRK